jgi:hypothetical protein
MDFLFCELGHVILHKGQGALIMGHGSIGQEEMSRVKYEVNRFIGKLINRLSRR